MIDRLLLELPYSTAPAGLIDMLQSRFNKLSESTPDGELVWEKPRTSKLRSDDPDVNLRFAANGLQIWGSPAMVMGSNNVFGSSDIRECANAMVFHVSKVLQVVLPSLESWHLRGLDITHNYLLDSCQDVRSALGYFGRMSNGRLKTTRYPESVYFGMGSKLRTGKIYQKGPQLEKLQKRLKGRSLGLTDWEKAISYNLLRLELCLKAQWLKRYALLAPEWRWYNMSAEDMDDIFDDFWSGIFGEGIEVDLPPADIDIEGRILDAAASLGLSEGQGLSAFKTWCCIQSFGYSQTQYITTKPTWYRHLKILRRAGLTTADMQSGQVCPVRVSTIQLGDPVQSWDDIRRRLAA